MNFHSRSELINEINAAKEQTILLKDTFYDERSITSNTDIAIIQIRSLASTISSLHEKFIPHNKQQQKHMRDNFRNSNHSSIFNINYSISEYEFQSLIRTLKKMTINISVLTDGNDLMKKDCEEMKDMLNDLENLIP